MKEIKITFNMVHALLLTIMLTVLKLTHIINWSWWWIISPMWMPFAFFILIFVISKLYLFFRQ